MAVEGRTLAVVIPAYRAAGSIAAVVGRMPAEVDWIIIVNDASPDGLDDAVAALADPRIVRLKHATNQGVGGAMVTGFRHALSLRADYVAKVDADNQMDPQYLPCFVRAAIEHQCDYVKANRFGHLKELRSMPATRKFGNIAMSFLTKLASGYWNVFDPQNGYLMLSGRALRRLNLDRIDRSYFFENSMLINLNIVRARVAEIYIPARYADEVSSLKIGRILSAFPRKLLSGLLYRIWQKYIFRSVAPVFLLLLAGVPATIFGVIWGAVAWYQSITSGIPATTGTVVLSLLPLIVGTEMVLNALLLDVQEAGPCILVDAEDFSDAFGQSRHAAPPVAGRLDGVSDRMRPDARAA